MATHFHESDFLSEAVEKFNVYVGQALRLYRITRRYTQGEVSAEIGAQDGISQAYISRVESGEINISVNRLAKFCTALGCRPSEVLERAEKLCREPTVAPVECLLSCLKNAGIDDEAVRRIGHIFAALRGPRKDAGGVIDETSTVLDDMSASAASGDSDPNLTKKLCNLAKAGAIPPQAIGQLVDIIHLLAVRTEVKKKSNGDRESQTRKQGSEPVLAKRRYRDNKQ
jgi:transcriptional regulator with XRE-family HTH domain